MRPIDDARRQQKVSLDRKRSQWTTEVKGFALAKIGRRIAWKGGLAMNPDFVVLYVPPEIFPQGAIYAW